ncbi:MAG: lamin tail domain-containing protein [Spongiibacteraceae bacterium]
MKFHNVKNQLSAIAAACFIAAPAHAAIIISEISPWSSGDSSYAADWFELTNTGAAAVNISGWKVDDNSNSFASSIALNGVSSIAAGQSVIFIEGSATTANNFKSAWFGSNVPAGFAIGYYSGSGIGLSTGGDAVNIFNSTGTLITRVAFGASTSGRTFDNSAGLSNASISTLSAVGVNGAFTSATGGEIGSPGVVPLPGALPLMMSAFGLIGGLRLHRKK